MADQQQLQASTLAEVSLWLDQYAAAAEQLKSNTAAAAVQVWSAFDAWYDLQAVAKAAAEAAGVSKAGQEAMVGAATQYVANVVAALRDTGLKTPTVEVPPVRNGADPLRVHTRPAEVFRRAYAIGADDQEARDRALERAKVLTDTDLTLVERAAQEHEMKALDVHEFRRVLRPELSKSGLSCGLCIVASDRIYHTGKLMPLHDWCNCKTLPIVGEHDPGRSLNAEDLQKLYDAAGSTAAADLKKVRVAVHEHGELGPVLARKGDAFRGPKDVPLDQDPARAERMLAKVAPVLRQLEERAAAGEDVTGPLEYQRQLIDRLRGITAAAA